MVCAGMRLPAGRGALGSLPAAQLHAIGAGLVHVKALLDGVPAAHCLGCLAAVVDGVEQCCDGHALSALGPGGEVSSGGVGVHGFEEMVEALAPVEPTIQQKGAVSSPCNKAL